MAWPFVFLHDQADTDIGWVLVNGPIVSPAQQAQFVDLRHAGYRFAGMSSYLEFPLRDPADTLDYEAVCEVWCHCFREPSRFLSSDMPRALISASDFCDPRRIAAAAGGAAGETNETPVDIVYVGALEAWKRPVKSWALAGQAIPRLCRELGLRALVIGAPTPDFPAAEGVVFHPSLPWGALLRAIQGARLLFVPNGLDPSPRVLAEALSLDTPVLVNRAILGGWKYVNRFTGRFFDGLDDVVAAARAVLDTPVAPRRWFAANHGPVPSGERLLRLLRQVDRSIRPDARLWLSDAACAPAPEPSH